MSHTHWSNVFRSLPSLYRLRTLFVSYHGHRRVIQRAMPTPTRGVSDVPPSSSKMRPGPLTSKTVDALASLPCPTRLYLCIAQGHPTADWPDQALPKTLSPAWRPNRAPRQTPSFASAMLLLRHFFRPWLAWLRTREPSCQHLTLFAAWCPRLRSELDAFSQPAHATA